MKLPIGILALDIVGTLLLGLGVWGRVSGGRILNDTVDLDAWSLPLIIAGVLLMAPLVLYLVKQATQRQR